MRPDYYCTGSAMSGAHLATSEIHKGVGHADALSRCETPELDVKRLGEWESRATQFYVFQPPRLAPAV